MTLSCSITYLAAKYFIQPRAAERIVTDLSQLATRVSSTNTQPDAAPHQLLDIGDLTDLKVEAGWASCDISNSSFIEFSVPITAALASKTLINLSHEQAEGVGEVNVTLGAMGFAVASLTLRPCANLSVAQSIEWLAQFAALEQELGDRQNPQAEWKWKDPIEPTEGGAREALTTAFEKMSTPLFLRAASAAVHRSGFWDERRHRLAMRWNTRRNAIESRSSAGRRRGGGKQNPTPAEAFRTRYTHGVHISACAPSWKREDRRQFLSDLQNRIVQLHDGPRQHVEISPPCTEETWLLGEFAALAASSSTPETADAPGAPPNQTSPDRACWLKLSKVLALRKGILNAVNRATSRSIMTDTPIRLRRDLREWQWLTTVAGQDFLSPWDAGRLDQLVHATEDTHYLKGLWQLQKVVQGNLESFERQTRDRVESNLGRFLALLSALSFLGLALDASIGGPGYEVFVPASLIGAAVVVLSIFFLTVRRRTRGQRRW